MEKIRKHILLPTDFSFNSKNAIDYAIKMFGNENVTFILINSYSVPHAGASLLVSIDDILKNDANEELETLQKELKHKYAKLGLEIQTSLYHGDVVSGIRREIKQKYIDLVVMGTKGNANMFGYILGSNTIEVIQHIETPVLVIPEDVEFEGMKHIGFAKEELIDLNKDSKEFLKWFVKGHHSSLIEFTVKSVEESISDGTESKYIAVERGGKVVNTDVAPYYGTVIEGIDTFIKYNSIDCLVLVPHHKKFVDHLFQNSTTRKLLLEPKLPILVMNS